MPLNDIMNNWYQSLEDPIDEEPPGSEASVDDLMDLDSYEDGEANMPELLAYQNFIFQSPAYEWLLANLRREFFLTSPEPNYMEIIGKKIIQCLPSSHVVSRKRSAESYEITFEIEWSPLAFVSEQMYKEELGEAIENAITLTGSTNDAQALTCAQYLCQTWPLSGEYTIKLIKDVVRSGAGHQHTCVIPDNTKLTAWMQGSKFIVGAFGTGAAISEIGEQLAWLGAALRSSPYETGVTWSIPFIDDIIIKNVSRQVSGISDPPIIICKIGFNVEKQGFFQLSNGQCWHNLFRNPVVVKGYPIPRRSETDAGLEIPLNLMAGLTGARRVNSFNGKLFIKGFSSMLIPTKRNRDILVWHLLYNQDGARISYLETTVPHAENINISNLESARHILGWCSEVKYCAGAVDANYAIKPSRLPRSYVGCSLDDVLIHKGQIITGGFPFAIGHKDVPVHITRNGYIPKLKWIHTKFVVFWDEEDKRGWLVNGTSALLHLLRASLEYDSTDEFSFEFCFKREDMQEAPEMHKAYSAVKVLQNKQNLKLKIYPEKEDFLHLEGRVEELYDTLEKTIDHQVSIAGQYDIRPRKYLEGWDFNDMARCRDLIYPRVTTLHTAGKGWVDFTRSLHAITLFGRGFGEIIKPVNTTSCHRWTKLPKGEHYLAASVYDLKRIMEMDGDQEANPMKLNHNIIWHTTDKIFEPCQCIGKEKEEHSDLVQVLLPSTFNNIQSKKSHVQLEDFGAVIFGHSNNFKWFWKDTGSPEHGELPHEGLNIESHDSGLGSDLSSSVVEGSRAYSQQLSSETLSTDTFIPENYTVGVVCALQKELMAVRLLFDRRHPDLKLPLQDTNHYALGRIEQHNVVAACLPSGEYGTNSAAVVVSHMVRSFPAVKFCLLVGIGGGVPSKQNDIRLGDVIVSLPTDTHTGVIQYDLGKALGNSVFERTGSLQRPPHFLMTAISSLMSDPDFSPKQLRRYVEDISTSKPEYKYPGVKHDKLFVSDYVHNPDYETCGPCNGKRITRKNRSGNHPNIHYGLIASGNQVIKDAKTRDLLGAKYRMLCFEMEAAGVLNTIPCLVIRGICDYSDSHKNKLWQEYAAATAAAYTKMLLSVVRNLNDLEIMPTDSETIRSAKRPASSQLARSAMGKKRRDLSLS
ncbi:hypothetical protein F5884DRAFT_309735 [Xylogone sp. PMI_703]|nr:hypothetical protein F5884DRAFT_309735 [Xylogone sp. PMI_703]